MPDTLWQDPNTAAPGKGGLMLDQPGFQIVLDFIETRADKTLKVQSDDFELTDERCKFVESEMGLFADLSRPAMLDEATFGEIAKMVISQLICDSIENGSYTKVLGETDAGGEAVGEAPADGETQWWRMKSGTKGLMRASSSMDCGW